MSRSRRKHLAPAKLAKRGPKNKSNPSDESKTTKQRRSATRAALRKEWP